MRFMKALLVLVCCTSLLQAQGGPPPGTAGQSDRVIGVIQSVDSAAKRIVLKSDAGLEVHITFADATRFLRVAPGAKDLSGATAIVPSDLGLGDRILARGRSAGDSRSLAAASIIVMSKADIAIKHAAERADWEQRGIGGLITALAPASREIMVKGPAVAGGKPLVIGLVPNAVLRRYAPDSVKFSDARPCRIEDLQIGDQVKALGSFNEDRTRFTAEELVAGSFRNIVGTVASIDAGQNTIQVADLATGKRLQANVVADTTVRRLSGDVAQMIAMRMQGSGPSSGPGGTAEADRTRSNGDLQAALERLPHIPLTDLKPGDAVILACTSSSDPSRLTAITLLAGVEPLLKLSSKGGRPLDLGSWNLDLNMSAGIP